MYHLKLKRERDRDRDYPSSSSLLLVKKDYVFACMHVCMLLCYVILCYVCMLCMYVMYVCMSCMYVCTHVCMYVRMYVWMYMYVCMYHVWMDGCMYDGWMNRCVLHFKQLNREYSTSVLLSTHHFPDFPMVDKTKNLIAFLNRATTFLGKIRAEFLFFQQ